jgi:hypothetical protein
MYILQPVVWKPDHETQAPIHLSGTLVMEVLERVMQRLLVRRMFDGVDLC